MGETHGPWLGVCVYVFRSMSSIFEVPCGQSFLAIISFRRNTIEREQASERTNKCVVYKQRSKQIVH